MCCSVPPLLEEVVDDAPDDSARPRRLEWAALLKRTFSYDVLVCPCCSGPMRLIAIIDDEHTAKRILDHLDLSSRAPPAARPRRPGQQLLDLTDGIDPLPLDD